MIGLMIEVIPSEIVLAYGGYLVSQNSIRFGGAVLFGTIGGTLAQLFLYWLGKYGGRPFVDRYGKYLLITERHVRMAEQWFARYGAGVVFGARFIPGGAACDFDPGRHGRNAACDVSFLDGAGRIAVVGIFYYIGYKLGENWMELDEMARKWILAFGGDCRCGYRRLYCLEKQKSPTDLNGAECTGNAAVSFRIVCSGTGRFQRVCSGCGHRRGRHPRHRCEWLEEGPGCLCPFASY